MGSFNSQANTKMEIIRGINSAFAALGVDLEDTLKVLTEKTNGGNDGVIRGTYNAAKAENYSDLLVEPSGSPDLYVTVLAGMANISDRYIHLTSDTVVGPFSDHANRYDIVQMSKDKVLSIKQGTAVAGATSPDADNINIGECHLSGSDGAIAAGDITDRRSFS